MNAKHFNLFLDNRNMGLALLKNSENGMYEGEITFFGMITNLIAPYTINRFAGQVDTHTDAQQITLIRNMIASLYPNEAPNYEIRKSRTINTMSIDGLGQNIPVIREYTLQPKETRVILPNLNQLSLNIDVEPETIYNNVKKSLKLE